MRKGGQFTYSNSNPINYKWKAITAQITRISIIPLILTPNVGWGGGGGGLDVSLQRPYRLVVQEIQYKYVYNNTCLTVVTG
jgi:hypothetical protein